MEVPVSAGKAIAVLRWLNDPVTWMACRKVVELAPCVAEATYQLWTYEFCEDCEQRYGQPWRLRLKGYGCSSEQCDEVTNKQMAVIHEFRRTCHAAKIALDVRFIKVTDYGAPSLALIDAAVHEAINRLRDKSGKALRDEQGAIRHE